MLMFAFDQACKRSDWRPGHCLGFEHTLIEIAPDSRAYSVCATAARIFRALSFREPAVLGHHGSI